MRRSFVLVAVLVVVGSALLITMALLSMMQAEAAGGAYVERSVHARAIARSGVVMVMAELNRQRDVILEGDMPRVLGQYEVYRTSSSAGVIRLVAVDQSGKAYLSAESGRLDVNRVTAEMLESTGLIDAAAAQAIVEKRQANGAFASVLALAAMDEFDARDLVSDSGDAVDVESDSASGRLAEVLTVFGHEPPLQRSGDLRINLNVGWSDELGRRLDRRFGQGAGQAVQALMNQGVNFAEDESFVHALNSFDVDLDQWPEILDVLSSTEADYLFGRVNINAAPLEVLMALPGVSPELASRIVDERETLGSDERWTPTWLITRELMEPLAYASLADHITTRSWTYRLQFEVGVVDSDDLEGPIAPAVMYEAVIDLAAPQVRLASLREVTHRRVAMRMGSDLMGATAESPLPPGFIDAPRENTAVTRSAPDRRTMNNRSTDDSSEEAENSGGGREVEGGPATAVRVGRWRAGG